jgi:hypothetical protein
MKHNGYTNYATWRVNLEIFDDIEIEYWVNLLEENPSAYELGEHFKEYAEELISQQVKEPDFRGFNFAESYALAFIDSVNWREIAQHTIDDYKVNYVE